MNGMKLLKAVLWGFVFAAGFFSYRLLQANRELEDKVHAQELKTNSLMAEVGEAKQDNTMLYQKFLESQKSFEKLVDSVSTYVSQSQHASTPEVAPVNADTSEEKIPRVQAACASCGTRLNSAALPEPDTFNVLIVGQHDHLADSITLAMINRTSRKIFLVSIPRDLSVSGRKINEYLSLYGIDELVSHVSAAADLTIEKYVVFDFKAFETIVDALGGVDVVVPKDIYDNAYPDGKGNYEMYTVSAGSHHMDGAEALKYSRSRHSTSDFDRSKRQQQVMRAIQERVINFDFLHHLDAIQKLYNAIVDNVSTDISFAEALEYIEKFQDFTTQSGETLSTGNLLYSTANTRGQYILLPRSGDFMELQRYLRSSVQQ